MDGRCIRPLANVFSFSFSSREYLFPSPLRRQKQAACHDLKRWLACVGLPSKLVSLSIQLWACLVTRQIKFTQKMNVRTEY